MSRKKKFKTYREPSTAQPKAPLQKRSGIILLDQIVVPDEKMRTECTQRSSDGTRIVPCVQRGRVANHPTTQAPEPPQLVLQGRN